MNALNELFDDEVIEQDVIFLMIFQVYHIICFVCVLICTNGITRKWKIFLLIVSLLNVAYPTGTS